jgi:hypothetical protein
MKNKLRQLYRIEGGVLDGTEIEPCMALILVKYPHRKTKDCYVPPMKSGKKEFKAWHCCQENCPNPDFKGGIDALLEHLMLHRGRLLKPWSKQRQLKSPIPAIRIPKNPWDDLPKQGVNEDRRFCVELYIDSVKIALRKQGLEILEEAKEDAPIRSRK